MSGRASANAASKAAAVPGFSGSTATSRIDTVRRTLRCAAVLRFESMSLSAPHARALEQSCSNDIRVRYGSDEPEEPLDAAPFEPPAGTFLVAYLEVDGGD